MFRFTIRDVLWLTVVVAVACGWYLDHRRTHETYNKLLWRVALMRAEQVGGGSGGWVTQPSTDNDQLPEEN